MLGAAISFVNRRSYGLATIVPTDGGTTEGNVYLLIYNDPSVRVSLYIGRRCDASETSASWPLQTLEGTTAARIRLRGGWACRALSSLILAHGVEAASSVPRLCDAATGAAN